LTQLWPAWQQAFPQLDVPGGQVLVGVQTPLVQVVFVPQQTVPHGAEPWAQVWQAPPTQIWPLAQQAVPHDVVPDGQAQALLKQPWPVAQQVLPQSCWPVPQLVWHTPGAAHT
jgi:hypothetical protein